MQDSHARQRQALSIIPSTDWTRSEPIDVAQLLAGFSSEAAQAVLRMTDDQTYDKGVRIFALGDHQNGLYVVKKGLAEEFRLTENGDRLPMSRIGPGKLFAFSCVDGRYCCFADAVEESVIGFLSFQKLEQLCVMMPKVAVALVQHFARRLGAIEERLEQLAFGGLRARVAWSLLGLYGVHGERLRGVTHEALATWAAGSRPKVSAVLADLQEAKLVRLSRAEIEIRDPSGLAEWAKQAAVAE